VGEYGSRDMSKDDVVDILEKHGDLLLDILRPVEL
jgi:hypothetical protein